MELVPITRLDGFSDIWVPDTVIDSAPGVRMVLSIATSFGRIVTGLPPAVTGAEIEGGWRRSWIVEEPSISPPFASRATGVLEMSIRSPLRITNSSSTKTTPGKGNSYIVCPATKVANSATTRALLLTGDVDGDTGSGKACACPFTTIFEAVGSIDTF